MDDALVDENTGSTDGALKQAFQRAKDTIAELRVSVRLCTGSDLHVRFEPLGVGHR